MSALARFFNHKKIVIAGYDRVSTSLTQELENEGIKIIYEDKEEKIFKDFKNAESNEKVVIYTPAIPKDSKILNFFINHNYSVYKRSEVLGIISKNVETIAISGTHGKTTVSSMTSHIFATAGKDFAAFVGGISINTGSNLTLPKEGKNIETFIVEADEFDRSLLQLSPEIAVITAIDEDHLDIYADKNDLLETFQKFAEQINKSGKLLIKKGLSIRTENIDADCFTYSREEKADFYAEKISCSNIKSIFDLITPEGSIKEIELGMPGKVNVENAVAASALAYLSGIKAKDIKEALKSYKGVKRRFEYLIKTEKNIYIDDYAHHPQEISALLNSVRNIHQGKKITVIFQPHLYSRTKDFAEGFAQSLSIADKVILLPIYPAREKPIEGVSSTIIFNHITAPKIMINKNELEGLLKVTNSDIFISVGAGDIGEMTDEIKKIILEKTSNKFKT